MKKILTFLTIYIAVSILYALPADIITDDNLHGYSIVEMQNLGIPKNLRMISVEDLEKELRSKPPMAVGFDIDDTVIFSSAAFYRAKKYFISERNLDMNSQKYWDKINCGWDAFSLPKEVAFKLIMMHKKHGDTIFFITGRKPSECKFTEKYLEEVFSVPTYKRVFFTGSSTDKYPKSKIILDHNIRIFYGDADSDIISARIGGAEGIRIMRTSNSVLKPLPENGKYKERIIINSDN